MLDQMIKLADNLDAAGHKEESDLLDELMPHIKKLLSSKDIDDDNEDDSEGEHNYMALNQLESISEKSKKIKECIEDGCELEDWMETYISQADLMIDNICDRLLHSR